MNAVFDLIILRHGQSQWNLENRFTGWTEINLTETGRQEARLAGQIMNNADLQFDLAFTSVQDRAMESLEIVLETMRFQTLPVQTAWQLNERHYGTLQGLNKAETATHLGEKLVMAWRRSYQARPPALEFDDYRHPRFDPRYNNLPAEYLPRGELLRDTVERLLPYWQTIITPSIQSGKRILIVAHGNSLRALMKYLADTPDAKVPGIHIPTGKPLVCKLDSRLKLVQQIDLEQPHDRLRKK